MTEKHFEVQYDGWRYFHIVDTINERCIARLDTKADADAYLEIVEFYEELSEENEELKHHLSELQGQNEILTKENEKLKKENEQLNLQMLRLYNYFADWFDDIMPSCNFSEMWDRVKEDEKWD